MDKEMEKEKNICLMDKLKFNGEYLNGKIWKGKRNEYYSDGKLRFKGTYLNENYGIEMNIIKMVILILIFKKEKEKENYTLI